MGRLCQNEDCNKYANFGMRLEKAKFCRLHKMPEMVNVISKQCEFIECDRVPTFDIQGGKGRFCKLHKSLEMVDVKNKRCHHDGCISINPIFNISGGKGMFCSKHKSSNMIDVVGRKCEIVGCDLTPSFDIRGGKGRFCKSHKTPNMVDVKNKRCEHVGCEIKPIFDIKGGKGRFCKAHKSPEMIDVKNRYCLYDGCNTTNPGYDIKGGKGRFCAKHKMPDMLNVKDKYCEYEKCMTLATFNIEGRKAQFCKKHKTVDMIHVKEQLCEQPECTTRATFGKPGIKVSHCSRHKLIGMIQQPNARCYICKNSALWGINNIPRHCDLHKNKDDINLLERPCISCGLTYILDNNNKCENCNPVAFLTARLAKQNNLMDYLDSRGLTGNSTDTVIDKGECGKERPDRVYDLGDKIIIIECDEHQHKDRQYACEQNRMINIGQSFGGLPVYFIRWNPDKYVSKHNVIHTDTISLRHRLVGDLIESIINNNTHMPTALVSVIYMYYDGWISLAEEEWKIITSFT